MPGGGRRSVYAGRAQQSNPLLITWCILSRAAYHAGLESQAPARGAGVVFCLRSFLSLAGDLQVIVATIAFGWGRQGHVRTVIHIAFPAAWKRTIRRSAAPGRDAFPSARS